MATDHRGETVVFVHGLWMHALVLKMLGRFVARAGFQVRYFSYRSVMLGFPENSLKLSNYIDKIDASRIHFVGHSMAGQLLRHYLARFRPPNIGKVVMLGPPNQGSYVAAQLNKTFLGRLLLGKSVQQGLLGGAPDWPADIPLGVLAGNLAIGAGRIFPGLAKPNDGTVAVAETVLDGMQAHRVLPVSHTSMLFSSQVASCIVYFLEQGQFPANIDAGN